ncbi:high affinity immunoglobulin epsilon receptor subunit beta [Ochotona princeps]|uniref:high affinity immunoglobulin epsilon receptor subunit beta n=1 Tax=Ochotona princeps TaxID=9978 RepID=UPI00032B021C|nr:high affinity immunoglobulin epsilon receptor subunit beta [Ochotona princeps]
METGPRSRTDIALPTPSGPSSVSEIELSEISPRGETSLQKPTLRSPGWKWFIFLKKEMEFLGVTQILISFICLYLGTTIYSAFNVSEFEGDVFSSFKAGYPFWGALFFATSGFLSIMAEEKKELYLARGSLGANSVTSIVAVTGILILTFNLQKSLTFTAYCRNVYEVEDCFVASFSTEIVVMMLFVTILGFCSAVALIVYGVGEELIRKKVPDERLYEELNIYAPIYSELETKGEETTPID